jgi:hypothetical protein
MVTLERYDYDEKVQNNLHIGSYQMEDEANKIMVRVAELLEDDLMLEDEHIRRIIQVEANNSRRFHANNSIPGLHDEIRQWVGDLTFLRTRRVNLANHVDPK